MRRAINKPIPLYAVYKVYIYVPPPPPHHLSPSILHSTIISSIHLKSLVKTHHVIYSTHMHTYAHTI